MPPSATEPSLQSLTVHLLKDCREPIEALRSGANPSRHELRGIGILLIRRARPKAPSWASFFESRVDDIEFGRVASPGAVLLITAGENHFAVTFGSGRFLLDPLRLEQRFGLHVVLNTIDDRKVRSIDKQSFDRLASQSRVQTSRDASPGDFGVDIEQDLLKAVAGVPKDATPGETIAGLDALHVNTRVTLDGLKDRLAAYFQKSRETRYRRCFPWVDQIAEVRDPVIRTRLDHELVELLKSGQTDKCWLAPEHIINWHTVSRFQYGTGRKAERHTQLALETFLEHIDDLTTLSPESLNRQRIVALRADDTQADEWPAMRCLYSELTLDRHIYVLNAGKWYQISSSFRADVDAAVAQIPRCDLKLPAYEDKSEPAYSERVCAESPSRFALMDRKFVYYGGGHSQIEFCDLYSDAHDLIHLKRYSGSAALSHLFAQAVVSGELMCSDEKFRDDVNKLLAQSGRAWKIHSNPTASDYRVVLGVIGGPDASVALPFFSRVTLKNAHRRLRAYGFQVATAHIPLTDIYAKTRSIPAKLSRRSASRRPVSRLR